MSKEPDILDVCIIGDGFAGMNVARSLAKNNIKCELFSTGFGASQLWVGTVDLLNTKGKNLESQLEIFKKTFPNHPYCHLKFEEIEAAVSNFSIDFSQFTFFKSRNRLTNRPVLTTIGSLKPCIGSWNTIFHDFEKFNEDSTIFMIDFKEFNNSAMHLVKSGLKEHFKGNFEILNLSFIELLSKWLPNAAELDNIEKLSENQIANYFDKYYEDIDKFIELINLEIEKKYKVISKSDVSCFLFPPILGLNNNQKILTFLTQKLNVKCGELVAFSPSLMSKRFLRIFENKLDELSVKINRGFVLEKLDKIIKNNNRYWKIILENHKGEQKLINSKYIVIAVGSLFQDGLFNSINKPKKNFEALSIRIPNKMSKNYELIYLDNINSTTGIFVCGSALYKFMGEFSDDQEIKYGTGLGLAIVSSHKVADEIINQLKI